MPLKKIKEHLSNLQKNHWKNESRSLVLKSELEKFRRSFKQNFVTLMISSLGLLVALTWNNFWNAWVATLSTENTLMYKFYISISMTILAVVLTYLFSRMKGKD
jgi:uncharacterized protein YdiU (UPF0061 family)